jgi:predicted flap endonuclease-1-like 5' DNA nuclease
MLTYLALIIFIIVVLIVWWALTRNAKKYKPDFELHPHEEAHPAAEVPVEEVASQPLEEPAVRAAVLEEVETPVPPLQPDDLTVIEGIGLKINQLLHDAGIISFTQLGATDVSKIREILDPAGLKFFDPASWAEQARLLSENRQDELKALQWRLRAGRIVD